MKTTQLPGLWQRLTAYRKKRRIAAIREKLARAPLRAVSARPDFPAGGTMATVRARLKRKAT